MRGLVEFAAGWPLAASIAAAITVRSMRIGRRRLALNQALHELRRPLQAIALASGPESGAIVGVEGSVRLAAVALERLEREINGGVAQPVSSVVPMRPLLEAAVGRWRARACLGGGTLVLRWEVAQALVEGDGAGLAQAIDNLIVNAIEHGGPEIVVEAQLRDRRLRISVSDSGRASRPQSRRDTPADVIARLSGRRHRGHGLVVVRRVVTAHAGRFALRHTEQGSRAVLELPLAAAKAERAA
jgi:signal transduction histidine kinase